MICYNWFNFSWESGRMTNMYFQVCSFFYMVMILVMFFSKKRIKNGETKLFTLLSIINIIGIILDIVIVYLSYVTPGHMSLYILNKFYLIYILFWTALFSIYITYITLDKKYKNYYVFFNLILTIVATIIIFVLPIYLFNENNVMYTYGPSVTLLYLSEVFFVFMIMVVVLSNVKKVLLRKQTF